MKIDKPTLTPVSNTFNVPASELERLLQYLHVQRTSGSLTINLANGTPSGYLEWKETVKI